MDTSARPRERALAGLRKPALAGLVTAALAAGAIGTAPPASAAPGDPAVVPTDRGGVRGTVQGGLRSFQGIPYAAPPGRWTSPQPAAAWTGVRDATRPGPACAQPAGLPIGVPGEAEDCLHLNVTTPGHKGDDLPVIVWIHGGSMMYGTGDMYGPNRLAADAVVVSMNYRLGVMSFLTDPALDAGSAYGSGSYALEDQQAALRWVRANIDGFGGDAGNVTIMGQSGGGYAVCDHLASPMSAGLFDRAIIQSGPCATGGSRTRAEAEADSDGVIKAVGCDEAGDVAACLRSSETTVAELLEAYGPWGEPRPVSGTPLLPLSPAEAFRTGRFNRVPVLIGVNHDEENGRYAGMEIIPGGSPIPPEAYEPTVREQYGAGAGRILARYPLSAYGNSAGLALATIGTDRDWAKPTYDTAKLLSAWTRTYMFEFAEEETPWFVGYDEPSFPWRAQHMAELAYQFDMALFPTLTRTQGRLADRLIGAWTRFAEDGNPNGRRDGGWQRFTERRPHVQSLTSGRWKPTEFTRDHQYAFWTSLS
ncbi:carboxylesterase family protein [Micromonospora sp. KC606]|uniref:carboxylesterase/lipase family protein n=1 Tax=Micromonospora sp. KC606 TaxID=2530379 RepID=UPI00105209CE|nr:carboxylesterase family protein [Micromonospora sp. KC606]TDC78676.1 carboxylesterase family protein [Micromonospora sp. KC606]